MHASEEHIDISEVHSGYFAKNTLGEEIDLEIDMDGELKNADSRRLAKDAFSLIMRDKERLLSFNEPVQFIFAHSALREGWDNPNVFQICTLRQLKAETARRQTIGRGLRLCVNQEGVRLTDPSLNILTVIVPESFADYVNKLQQEYVEEGYQSPPKPTDATGNPPKVTRRESIYTDGVFRQFWTSLNRMSHYTIYSDTDVLVRTIAEELQSSSPPRVEVKATYGEWRWAEVVLSFGALHYTKDNKPGGCYVTLVLKDTQGVTHKYENIRVNVGKTLAHVFSQVEQTLRNELKRYKLKEIEIIDKDYYRAVFVTMANQELLVSSTKPLVLAVSSSVGEHMDSLQPSIFGLSVQKRNTQSIDANMENADSPETMLNVPILLAREITNRLMQETGLTRRTVVRIWKSLGTNHQICFVKHKEMCFEWLLSIVRNTLVNHIAERISFNVDFEKQNDMYVDDEIFEREMSLSQVEIIETNANSLYTHVWRDSDIEENFISIIQTDNQIVCWFKFPSKFKFKLPKLIGNYNPDWGVVRHDVQGSRIELVRETKGTEKINDLSSSERAKVNCAIRLFEALGVKYRVITDKTEKWWE
jgi:type III restriction enzyme